MPLMTTNPVSYVGPMSEGEYLAAVERIQQAMAIEPFRPPLVDVVKLLADWRVLRNDADRLLADNAELSAECDQWGEKVAELWEEVARLRAREAP